MAGDPVRDAFRAELQAVMTAASIPWPLKDTLNARTPIGATQSYITLSFFGGDETPSSFGDPGNNIWREHGIVMVELSAVAGSGAELAEAYSNAIRDGFRNRRFLTADSKSVRILSVSPLAGGEDDRVAWREVVALEYRVFNVG